MAHFYTHLVKFESLLVEFDKMNLSESERSHLSFLVDSSFHHQILDLVLSELSEDDKKIFMKHLQQNENDKLWSLLKSKVDNIEDKIEKCAQDLKLELHKDIERAKKEK